MRMEDAPNAVKVPEHEMEVTERDWEIPGCDSVIPIAVRGTWTRIGGIWTRIGGIWTQMGGIKLQIEDTCIRIRVYLNANGRYLDVNLRFQKQLGYLNLSWYLNANLRYLGSNERYLYPNAGYLHANGRCLGTNVKYPGVQFGVPECEWYPKLGLKTNIKTLLKKEKFISDNVLGYDSTQNIFQYSFVFVLVENSTNRSF